LQFREENPPGLPDRRWGRRWLPRVVVKNAELFLGPGGGYRAANPIFTNQVRKLNLRQKACQPCRCAEGAQRNVEHRWGVKAPAALPVPVLAGARTVGHSA
jgi:hypothetical protein